MTVLVGAEITRVFTADELNEGLTTGLGNVVTMAGGKEYKLVLYDEGTGALDLVAGDLVVYTDVTGYNTNTVTADVSDVSGTLIPAGIVAATAVTDDGVYFYIQLSGAATAAQTLGGSAGDGQALQAGADKTLTLAAEAGSGGYDHVCAYAVDASAKTIACRFLR